MLSCGRRNGGKTTCRFFTEGRCNRGSSCPYSHAYSEYEEEDGGVEEDVIELPQSASSRLQRDSSLVGSLQNDLRTFADKFCLVAELQAWGRVVIWPKSYHQRINSSARAELESLLDYHFPADSNNSCLICGGDGCYHCSQCHGCSKCKAGMVMCRYFLQGRCTRGSLCSFSHSSVPVESSRPLDHQRLDDVPDVGDLDELGDDLLQLEGAIGADDGNDDDDNGFEAAGDDQSNDDEENDEMWADYEDFLRRNSKSSNDCNGNPDNTVKRATANSCSYFNTYQELERKSPPSAKKIGESYRYFPEAPIVDDDFSYDHHSRWAQSEEWENISVQHSNYYGGSPAYSHPSPPVAERQPSAVGTRRAKKW